MLFFRALIAFLILPGTFAGLVPTLVVSSDRWRGHGFAWGAVPLVIGAAILFWCVRDFYVAGKGTLAPWDPPKHLVVVGFYRFVRNPMYMGILILLAGWALITGSALLAAYSGLLAVAFHLRAVLYEEPRLKQQFGNPWNTYAASVPRWLPRFGTRY